MAGDADLRREQGRGEQPRHIGADGDVRIGNRGGFQCRHFADRDELLAAVCAAAMRELADRMAAGVARVRGGYGDPDAARGRLRAISTAYLDFAREEPGLFATAFAVPQQHAYDAPAGGPGQDRTPLGQLRAALDELVDAGVLDRRRRDGIEYPCGPRCTGWPCSPGKAPCATSPARPASTSRTSPWCSSAKAWRARAYPVAPARGPARGRHGLHEL